MTPDLRHPITAATPGAFAMFRHADGDSYTEAVLAWDADGRALVLDHRHDSLIPAAHRDDFTGVNADHTAPPTTVPASDLEAGSHFPIVAYRIGSNGYGTPLVLDGRTVRPVTSDDPSISDRPAQVIEL